RSIAGHRSAVTKANSPFHVHSGEIDFADTVSSGGTMIVDSGGLAVATTVSSGGVVSVTSGGSDNGTVLHGKETIRGTDQNAVILAGGTASVSAGGLDAVATESRVGYSLLPSGGATD